MRAFSPVLVTLFLAGCLFGGEKDKDEGTIFTDPTSTTSTGMIDQDGDGHALDDDCDDTNATIYVGAPELCDGLDNDCDSSIDEDPVDALTWYADGDSDSYGAGDPILSCEQLTGTVENAEDCDDDADTVFPGADEYCNGVDDDCDTEVDEDAIDMVDYYTDGDGDSFGYGQLLSACELPADGTAQAGDCDDGNSSIYPGAVEVCNGIDDDCDGDVDEAEDAPQWYPDADNDGYGDADGTPVTACDQPNGYASSSDDCDDGNRQINPGAIELCDNVDNDCDGAVDEDQDFQDWYPDADTDGYGDASGTAVNACDQPSGYVSSSDDCDDSNRRINPGANEVCDNVDNDCDGDVDEDATDGYTLYEDSDGDGYGDAPSIVSCDPVSGYSLADGDCDDTDEDVNPSATEVCDGIDNDCDGDIDADDADAEGTVTVWPDFDGDGYGDGRSTVACEEGGGFVSNDDDCDDTDEDVSPAADELCDGIDNDCDGTVDEADAVDATASYADTDGDGYGDIATYDVRCDGVANALDCDDGDATEPQVADSAASGIQNGTATNPYDTIQEAIDAASQCVLVREGYYDENIDFGGNSVLVQSESGAGVTIIDGGGGGPVVKFATGETSGAELHGFTLMNGTGFQEETTTSYSCGSSTTCTDHYISVCGGGLYVDGAEPTLSDLLVFNNHVSVPADSATTTDFYYYYGFGGGMCVRNTVLEVSHVNLQDNSAEDGGGAYIESTAELEFIQGQVYGNTADFGAGFEVDGGSLTLTNAILAWNVAADSGGGVYGIDATVGITNVTVGECEAATQAGGIYSSGTSAVTMINSIVYGSDAGVGVLVDATATFTGSYDDTYDNTDGAYSGTTGGSNNITTDPTFAGISDDGDYSNDDWSLASGSPCINRGSAASLFNDADGTRNDIGAFGGPGSVWP